MYNIAPPKKGSKMTANTLNKLNISGVEPLREKSAKTLIIISGILNHLKMGTKTIDSSAKTYFKNNNTRLGYQRF